jgi:hypothetical protein
MRIQKGSENLLTLPQWFEIDTQKDVEKEKGSKRSAR